MAARMRWQPRPSPRQIDPNAAVLTGRGLAFVHYKHDETLVAMGMEVTVERATGRIRVTRVVCAQDCGLMINPDNVQAQLEGKDRKSTRLNSSHRCISYAVFCLKKKKKTKK